MTEIKSEFVTRLVEESTALTELALKRLLRLPDSESVRQAILGCEVRLDELRRFKAEFEKHRWFALQGEAA